MEKYFEEWDGNKYPVRVIPVDEDLGYGSPINVASYNLWEAIEDSYYKGDKRSSEIDNDIFCYCDHEFIANDPTDEEIMKYVMDLF